MKFYNYVELKNNYLFKLFDWDVRGRTIKHSIV